MKIKLGETISDPMWKAAYQPIRDVIIDNYNNAELYGVYDSIHDSINFTVLNSILNKCDRPVNVLLK